MLAAAKNIFRIFSVLILARKRFSAVAETRIKFIYDRVAVKRKAEF